MDNGASSYRRSLDGDEDGIIDIIRDYKDGLALYLNGFVQNIYTAEDLMEDTIVRLVVKKLKFSAKYSFKTWLYTIGRNVAIDYLRHNARLAPVSDEEFSGEQVNKQLDTKIEGDEQGDLAQGDVVGSFKG